MAEKGRRAHSTQARAASFHDALFRGVSGITGTTVRACPAWHLDGDRGFAYARFPLRSCLTGMRLPNEPISIETLLLRVAAGDWAAFHSLYAATASRLFAICGHLYMPASGQGTKPLAR
jgi:hypothetical protein